MKARGLHSTTRDSALVAAAIGDANLLLTGSLLRLRAAWQDRKTKDPAVPVYLVSAPADIVSTPAIVPRGCRCVFVNPTALAAWTTSHSTGSGRLELDRGQLLAFMLLHEAGHLSKDTAGAAIERGEIVRYNTDPSRAKADEEDADNFAAELVRKYKVQTPATAVSLEANRIASELLKIGWNMQAYRTLDEFGSYVTGKPAVYHDNGYTHPNLAWRVLRSNDLIQRTPETAELLGHFTAARSRGNSRQTTPSR